MRTWHLASWPTQHLQTWCLSRRLDVLREAKEESFLLQGNAIVMPPSSSTSSTYLQAEVRRQLLEMMATQDSESRQLRSQVQVLIVENQHLRARIGHQDAQQKGYPQPVNPGRWVCRVWVERKGVGFSTRGIWIPSRGRGQPRPLKDLVVRKQRLLLAFGTRPRRRHAIQILLWRQLHLVHPQRASQVLLQWLATTGQLSPYQR